MLTPSPHARLSRSSVYSIFVITTALAHLTLFSYIGHCTCTPYPNFSHVSPSGFLLLSFESHWLNSVLITVTMTIVHPSTSPGVVSIVSRLSVPPLPPGDFCSTSVLGTRRNNAFGDVINLDGALEDLDQGLNKGERT